MLRVMLFDRYDQPIGELSEDEVFALVRTEAVNGEHSLKITTTRVLEKGWRILTCDAKGTWREHVVFGTDALHDSGERPFGDYYCVWSLQADLMGTRVSAMPGVQNPVSAAVALAAAIGGTSRWQLGTVTNTNTGGGSMYDTNGWTAMSVLVANWGGEIDATIEVGANGVTARKADCYVAQGDQSPKRRYDFGADIKSIRRRIPDGPLYCRITPRGRGEETDDGYGRKITIESVNGGREWLENPAMVDAAKLPNGSGGWEYPTLEVENPDCETPLQLLAWGHSILEESTVPKITYEIDVLQLAREGIDLHGVSLGDAIQAVDRRFGDGIRVSGRVLEMAVNLLDEDDEQLTIGSIADDISSLFGNLGTQVDEITSTVQAMNGGTLSTAGYLTRLLERLNAEINATGGYTYITQGFGLRTYDIAVEDPTDGTEANAVVEVKGGTIRIANSKTAQGQWDWKTVFTSGHIAASVVTAAQITTGYIHSPGGTYINLDADTAQLGASAGAHTVFDNYGMEVFSSGADSVAYFGIDGTKTVSRVGRETGGNVVASSDGSVDIKRNGDTVAHFGYGQVREKTQTVYGYYSTLGARGEGDIGKWSHVEGYGNSARNYADHAEGSGCIANGSRETAIEPAHAEGTNTQALRDSAHAEGCSTVASGYRSHAEGYQARATGAQSHAEGDATEASGEASHAEGIGTVAQYEASHAAGEGTATRRTCHTVVGLYNGYGNHELFSVGIGTEVQRRTGFYVKDDGDAYCYGTLTQGSDRRMKEHVAYLGEEAADFARSLKPALFVKDGARRLGFYAQDVRDADRWDTQTVTESGEVDEAYDFAPLALDYTALIAPLVAYAQQLEARIERLEGGGE